MSWQNIVSWLGRYDISIRVYNLFHNNILVIKIYLFEIPTGMPMFILHFSLITFLRLVYSSLTPRVQFSS